MASKRGSKWNPKKLVNHKGMLGKSHGSNARTAISKAQSGRKHQPQEGFQKGHPAIPGTEKTRFYKGQPSWNKGNRNFDPIKRKLRTYRANAKRVGRKFEISLDEMREMLSKPCTYCGEKSTGIDRIDNKRGYIQGNMAPSCEVCNHMKWNLTKDQFIQKCKQIVTVVGYEI
jgi:hypothetical protein